MPFLYPPAQLLQASGLTWTDLVGVTRKEEPALHRDLWDWQRGKTSQPKRKTITKLFERLRQVMEKLKLGTFQRMLDEVRAIPPGPPWATHISAFDLGAKSMDADCRLLASAEAVRLEALQLAAFEASRLNDWPQLIEILDGTGLARLPSYSAHAALIEPRSSRLTIEYSLRQIRIVTGLYLLACFDADGGEQSMFRNLMPLRHRPGRDTRIKRPMTRLIEGYRKRYSIKQGKELASRFLLPRGLETKFSSALREFRTWRNDGRIPAWKRLPHIAQALAPYHGDFSQEHLHKSLREVLIAVRLIEFFLTEAEKSASDFCRKNPVLGPNFLAPFEDYPVMFELAREKKVALTIGQRHP
jgi:hypothetical protein